MKSLFSFVLRWIQNHSKQRMVFILGFYGAILLPSLILLIASSQKMGRLAELEEAVGRLPLRLEKVKIQQKDKNLFKKTYGTVDPYYLDHILEPMILLKPEVEALKLVYSHPAFQSCENVRKRLETLTKGGNRLMFEEKHREGNHELEEVYLSQIKPVEINENDLKTILIAVEGVTIVNDVPPNHRPQFILREFHLKKKKLAERETYLLEMQLIKRGQIK